MTASGRAGAEGSALESYETVQSINVGIDSVMNETNENLSGGPRTTGPTKVAYGAVGVVRKDV